MPVAQGRQAVGALLLRIFLVAHPQERDVEQAHQRGQHRRASRQRPPRARAKVLRHTRADPRQSAPESSRSLELGLVLHQAPFGVVAVLLAAARIDSGRLQVAVGQGTDPDIGVRGRNGQLPDAGNLIDVTQPLAPRIPVAKAAAMSRTREPRHFGIHVDEAVGEGHRSRTCSFSHELWEDGNARVHSSALPREMARTPHGCRTPQALRVRSAPLR